MHLLKTCLVSAGLLLILATGTSAQDDTDLIDDLPQERKEAAKENPIRAKRAKSAPGRRKTALTDDVSPEQKEAAEHEAARKNENAIPDNLADALARALRSSPAILVADAKVRQAQAELNEVRLSVVQELTLAFQRRASNKAALLHHEAAVKSGQETPLTSTNVHQAIIEDETKILYLLGIGAEHSAEAPQAPMNARSKAGGPAMMGPGMGMIGGTGGAMMPSMGGGMMGGMAAQAMGSMPGMGSGMGTMSGGMMGAMLRARGSAPAPSAKLRPAIPENVRKFLESRVDVAFVNQPLGEVLSSLEKTVDGDISFVGKENLTPSDGHAAVPVTLNLKQVTVELALQALSDLTSYCFIIRDYGILVEHRARAESYIQAGIPMIGPGIPGLPAEQSE